MVKEALELELMNAHVARQTDQFEKAKNFLDKIVVQRLPQGLLARYYALAGEIKVGLQDYEEALVDLEQALQLFEKKGPSQILEAERVRNWLGLVYYSQNKYQLAIEQHQRCLQAILKGWIDDPRFTMKIYCNLANENHHVGNHQEALYFYREALKLAEGGEDNSALAAIYWGVGLAYRSLDNLPMAKLYLDKSAASYQQLGELNRAGTAKTLLGLTLIELKEFSAAEMTLKSAVETLQNLKDAEALGAAYGNLAYLYSTYQDMTQAEQNSILALELIRQSGNKVALGQALGQLANIKLMQRATQEGFALFEEALAVLEQTESTEYLKQICMRYALALEKIGDLPKAIKFFKQAFYYQNQEHNKER